MARISSPCAWKMPRCASRFPIFGRDMRTGVVRFAHESTRTHGNFARGANICTLSAWRMSCCASRSPISERQMRTHILKIRDFQGGSIPTESQQNKKDTLKGCPFVLVSQSKTKSNFQIGNFINEYTRTCRLRASSTRSAWRMRTQRLHRRVRFLVRVTKKRKNLIRVRIRFFLVTRTGIEPMFSA